MSCLCSVKLVLTVHQSKDPSVKTSKTERDFLAIPHMQKQLLLAAIDSTDHHSKTGGYIVYSTCSVSVEENEQVVQYVLRKRPNVKIVDTGLGNFGSEGFKSYMGKKFDDKMALTKRFFPHRENVDGFYVCKLKKFGPSPHMTTKGAAAAGANGATTTDKKKQVDGVAGEDDIVDKTPIRDEDGTAVGEDAFGPFEEEADAELIARGERRRLRKKGLNPKAVLEKPKKDSDKNNEVNKEEEKKKKEDPKSKSKKPADDKSNQSGDSKKEHEKPKSPKGSSTNKASPSSSPSASKAKGKKNQK
jgi:ribosomal RNA methyltransferase Nop2